MQNAEDVVFGGSGLDRAAELRGDDKRIAELLSAPETRLLPVWRGKPLFEGAAGGWLQRDAFQAAFQIAEPVFIGLDDGEARFAVDVSGWEPGKLPDTLRDFFDPSEQMHPDLPEGVAFAELRGRMADLTPREAELIATGKGVLGWHATHKFCAVCGHPSDMIEAGWQRQCPSCGARHFPRTDPVVIMLITHGNDVLVGRSPGWPEGMYSLLAGFVEPGETIEAAVRREVFEESGIRVGQVDYLASQPWPFPASLMFGCQGAAISRDISLDPIELEDAIWVSREEMARIFRGEHDSIRPPRRGAIAQFLLQRWLEDRLD